MEAPRRCLAGVEGRTVSYFQFQEVTVTGSAPSLAGWTFVATLNHFKDETGATQNILKVVPGFDNKIPESYRHADSSNCDHCQKKITTRKDTFVVHHAESGQWKQVGRNCLCDFLGGIDPHTVAASLECLFAALQACKESEDDFGFGGGSYESVTPILPFLAVVAACIRVDGWLSRGKAKEEGGEATADRVLTALYGSSPEAMTYAKKVMPTAEDMTLAATALDFTRESLTDKADLTDLNDYEHNLRVACSLSSVGRKTVGIVASAIPYYTREMAKASEAAKGAGSVHFGEIGKRADFYLSMTSTFARDFGYGPCFVTKLVDGSGNVATWFASEKPEMEIGKVYRVTATPKKHDDYKGVKQTTLARCKVLSDSEKVAAEAKDAKKAAKAAKDAAKLGAAKVG